MELKASHETDFPLCWKGSVNMKKVCMLGIHQWSIIHYFFAGYEWNA